MVPRDRKPVMSLMRCWCCRHHLWEPPRPDVRHTRAEHAPVPTAFRSGGCSTVPLGERRSLKTSPIPRVPVKEPLAWLHRFHTVFTRAPPGPGVGGVGGGALRSVALKRSRSLEPEEQSRTTCPPPPGYSDEPASPRASSVITANLPAVAPPPSPPKAKRHPFLYVPELVATAHQPWHLSGIWELCRVIQTRLLSPPPSATKPPPNTLFLPLASFHLP